MISWDNFIEEIEKILDANGVDQTEFIEFDMPKMVCAYCKGPPDPGHGLTENGLCSICSYQLVMNMINKNLKDKEYNI